MNRLKSFLACGALIVAGALMPTLAVTQALIIEEVVVTAQKRAESAQDIPVSVTAIDANTIESLGLEATADVVRLTPSLTVIESNNKTNNSFSIRGIGTNVFGISAEQAVAMIIDDVAMPQQGQSMSNLVDIERIEVLRGPQSTLFGKATSASAINITTKAPGQDFEGSIELIATDENMYKVFGAVSGPLAPNLGFRLAGYTLDRDGFAKNLSPGARDTNGEESQGFRGKLVWDVTDRLAVDLGAYYSEEDSQCCVRNWHSISPGARFFGALPQSRFAEGITPSPKNSDSRFDTIPNSSTTSSGVNLRLSFDVGEFEFLSISVIDQWEYSNDEDVDFGDLDVLAILTRGARNGGFYSHSERDMDFFSQEFRVLSPQGEDHDYLIGLYYSDSETERSFFRNIPIAPSDNMAAAGTEYLGLFGQFNWHFNNQTGASIGLRYFREEISGEIIDFLKAAPVTIGGSGDDSRLVGKLSAQHFFNDDVMAFASFTRGYKGQMYDVRPGFDQEDIDHPVAPESSNSYELGVKSMLFEQRLQLNVPAFQTDYEITAFVNNAFEEHYLGDMLDASALFAGTGRAIAHLVPRNSQRYFGVKAKLSF